MSRASSGAINSIDAAALQAEMIKKYGVTTSRPIINQPRKPKRESKAATAVNSAPTVPIITCTSCGKHMQNPENLRIEYCISCGYFLPPPPPDASSSFLSLAQQRGLAPIKPTTKLEPIKSLEWYLLESGIAKKSDPDSCCPICMEVFNRGEEVLLSCGHIFHKVCLRSFENFMKTSDLSCPICRTKNYQKKMTNLGTQGYQRNCIRKIQAIWRGYWARKQFKWKLRRYYRQGLGNEQRRKKYMEKEFSALSTKIDQSFDNRQQQMNSLIRNMDNTLIESRQLDRLFDEMLANRLNGGNNTAGNTVASASAASAYPIPPTSFLPKPPQDPKIVPVLDILEYCMEAKLPWGDVYAQAQSRGACDCAICMIPIQMTGQEQGVSVVASTVMTTKRCVLLSCSHVFHEMCIGNFEKFARLEKTCPICRSHFSKRLIQ